MFSLDCKKIKLLANFIIIILCLKLYHEKAKLEEVLNESKCISEKLLANENEKPNVNIVNLSRPLLPKNLYERIMCRRSAQFVVRVELCVHDIQHDIHVSGSIWRDGVWEPSILKKFTYYLNENPDTLVLDIGAQIGQYSLFAAKMGRKVVAVEPFHDNILRIHKSVYLENLQDRIVLIRNAISNKRNEFKLLERVDENIGGQSLMHSASLDKNVLSTDAGKSKYLVETILFDDIIDYIPMRFEHNKTRFEKAILKIDIEGFEPYAFQYSKRLFNLYDIRIIFMEWGNLAKIKKLQPYIREMLNFFDSHKLIPYGVDEAGLRKKLDRDNYLKWPWDVYWEKKTDN